MKIKFLDKLNLNENPMIGRLITFVIVGFVAIGIYMAMFDTKQPTASEKRKARQNYTQEEVHKKKTSSVDDLFKDVDAIELQTLAKEYHKELESEKTKRLKDRKKYETQINSLKIQISENQVKREVEKERDLAQLRKELFQEVNKNKAAGNNKEDEPTAQTSPDYASPLTHQQPGLVPSLTNNALAILPTIATIKGSELQGLTSSEQSMIRTFKQPQVSNVNYIDGDRAKKQKKSIFVPAGSLLSATLLTGMDAPAGTNSKENPFPTLARIKGEIILPNYFTIDLEDCHMISSGYGSLASSRAYIRTEKISCVMPDGTAFEKTVDAYASGSDGKVGLMGKVITRNNEVLLQSLAAGILSGFASAAQPQKIASIDTTGSDDSVFTRNQMSDIFQSGVLGGTSSALDRLAQYYLEIAEEMFPVIEIKPGRKVDFITKSGFTIDVER